MRYKVGRFGRERTTEVHHTVADVGAHSQRAFSFHVSTYIQIKR
jgi:hypothetical protein